MLSTSSQWLQGLQNRIEEEDYLHQFVSRLLMAYMFLTIE